MAIRLDEARLRMLKIVDTSNTIKVYPNSITSYGGLVIEGWKKGEYEGIHLGPDADYMSILSSNEHQGLFSPINAKWILYYNKTSNSVGFGTNTLVANNKVTITGNASITDLLTVGSEATHCGIKVGDTYINAIGGDLILQNNSSIRFGGDSWNWDIWGGLSYDSNNKYIYLGIADKTIFDANTAQSGGRILTPGISYLHVGNQTTYYSASDGSIKASSITVDNNNSSGSIQLVEDGEGGTIRLYSKSNTYCYEIDAYNDETIRIHTAHKNPNGTNKFISWNGKTGNLSADGTFYIQNAYPVMPMKSANGYYGMTLPDVSDTNWIRTTNYGIIPYASGGSSALGTESWPFNSIYGKQIYGTLNGTASSAALLALHNTITSSTTRSTHASSWTGSISGVTYMWGQAFKDSSLGSDTGDLVLAVRAGQYTSGGTELCIAIDGDFYSMGNKVLHAGNYNSYALPLGGGWMNSGSAIKFYASAGSIATSDPMAITYGRISCYGTLAINADTDASTTEYVILTAGRGLSNTASDGLAVGYSTLTWQGATVMTSSNYSSWAAPASHTHNYAAASHSHSNYVDLTSAQTISGAKTFSATPTVYNTYYPSINFTNSSNGRMSVFEGSYVGSSILWSYNATSGSQNRRGIAINTQDYQSDIRNALWLRTCENNVWAQYQIITSVGGQTIAGSVNSSGVLGGTWINGTRQASFAVTNATTAAAGNYYQGWYSGKTQSGAWSMGALAGSESLYFVYGTDGNYNSGNNATASVQFGSGGQVYGAVWNDYAEYRTTTMEIEPGRVVVENNDDTLSLSTERLMPGANIVSDTFGFSIGETESAKTPLAVSGRVLAYPNEPRDSYQAGDAVCSGPNGTVSKMTREEIITYPERIIGTVSAIPNYETWGQNNVSVSGRIWIKV